MKSSGLCRILHAVPVLLVCSVALGQARVQFPSLLGDGTVPPPATSAPSVGASPYSPAPNTTVQPGAVTAPSPHGAPSPYSAPPTYAAPPTYGTQPTYGGQPSYPAPNAAPNYATPPPYGGGTTFGQQAAPFNPLAPSLGPQAAPVGPVPGAQFNGTIMPPPTTWDPYAPPGSLQPSLLPQDPHLPYNSPAFPTGNVQRFLQEARLDYVWMIGHGEKEFGANDVEVYGTFALPFFHNTQTPLLVTPGFAVHFWEGPITTAENPAAVPPGVYDAYLQGGWTPLVAKSCGGELAVRVGVHSDFKYVDKHSLRYEAKGLGVLSFSPNVKVKAGVWYLDRNRVKILPAGGLVWTPQGPDGNVVFEILFPNPRIAFRLADYQNTEWWLYGRGEYGGGAWAIKRANGDKDRVDYNDLRAAAGLEFIRPRFSGLFEAGIAFEREIRYVTGPPPITHPRSTFFLRGSLAY
ncbi:MAG: hypothetical protein U1E05_23725 [Patescibacteria group bacterium]|nr:hypothetical protein [Patescibacteria group bacterium]